MSQITQTEQKTQSTSYFTIRIRVVTDRITEVFARMRIALESNISNIRAFLSRDVNIATAPTVRVEQGQKKSVHPLFERLLGIFILKRSRSCSSNGSLFSESDNDRNSSERSSSNNTNPSDHSESDSDSHSSERSRSSSTTSSSESDNDSNLSETNDCDNANISRTEYFSIDCDIIYSSRVNLIENPHASEIPQY